MKLPDRKRVTVPEAASYLGLSSYRMELLLDAGGLRFERPGGRGGNRLIRREDVLALRERTAA